MWLDYDDSAVFVDDNDDDKGDDDNDKKGNFDDDGITCQSYQEAAH